jgi:flagellar motility protein MotE (MotC chaperone)
VRGSHIHLLATVDPIIGVIFAAIVGPVGAYILAARKMSGKIATTEAAQLWEESRAIREWSTQRMAACDKECSNLRSELTEALTRISALEKQNEELTEQLAEAHEHIAQLESGGS